MFGDMFGGSAGQMLSSLATKAKALAAGVTEIELKVLEATNEDKWGPHGNDMKEIARAAQDPEKRHLIMGVIWERLQEHEDKWRLCYKALLLCEFLVKQGPMRCVEELQSSIYVFERLRDNFHYKDADGRDQGINIRQRARELAALLSSAQKIQEEREKARANANKYTGVSAAEMSRGYGGYGSSSYNTGSGYGASSYSSADYHSSSHSRGGSGSGAADSSSSGRAVGGSHSKGNGGGRATADEDPFEATRKRIEALKAQTGNDGDVGKAHVPAGSIDMDASTTLFPEHKRTGPKRLSEVKVDPTIAAAFGGGLAAPPPPGSKKSSAGGAVPSQHAPVTVAAQSRPPDLLDMLGSDISSTSAGAPAPSQAQQGVPAAAINWDNLSFPAAAAQAAPAQPAVDLLAFPASAAPAATSKPAAADPFNLGGLGSSLPTALPPAAAAPSKHTPAPLAADLFADPFPAPKPAMPGNAAGPAPVAFLPAASNNKPATAPATSSDPFASVLQAAGFPAPGPAMKQAATVAVPAVVAQTVHVPASAGHSGGEFDPFAPSMAAPAAVLSSATNDFADPFSAFQSAPAAAPLDASHLVVAEQRGKQPALGPRPSKKVTDPFADLL